MSAARRKKRTVTARLRPYRVLLALLLFLLAGAAAFAALWPGFDPTRIEVVGNQRVPQDEILSRAAIARNENMWLQNTSGIAHRIEAIPYIETANIHRIPPTTMKIVVTERTPYAIVRSGDDEALADRTLRLLEESTGIQQLPVFVLRPGIALLPGTTIAQSDAVTLRNDYETMLANHLVPLELRLDRFGGLVATLPGPVRVLFGDDRDLSRKVELVNPILTQVVHNRARISAIDLRAPSTPVIEYR